MPSLTNPQKRALRALAARGGWATPYGLCEARRTLDALMGHGYVERRNDNAPGSIAHPNVTLEYTATDKGKEATRDARRTG